ncbi:MAG TPA: S8 family serine peptidase [Steroidobacteraceae bacterium]|nr:S8 family serine peptidase [Steroidobacteraceae bacterium]
MTSKVVGHGLKWAVCSALLSASTFAAVSPRDLSAVSTARLANVGSTEAVIIENAASPRLHPSLQGATGRQTILVRLTGEAVAKKNSVSSRAALAAEQAAFIDRALAAAPSAEVVATLQLVLNAVVLNVDAADLPALSRDTAITRVVGVADYAQDLSETVPYIGAATAHAMGVTGKGIRVAVIDSGIDYTHAALGGAGTQAAYEKAWAPLPAPGAPAIPTVPAGTGYLAADASLFPSAKVIGGYDFVGESWPNTGLLPDNNPVGAPDATTFGGHGTHVADIIAGKLGVAPDAKLYALKACSAPTSSCSGVALIEAMEWAVDPNNNGETEDDHVDVINMSLGSNYGQAFDDDLSAAVDAAFDAGVFTVASAGNGSDKQFVTGSPAAASSALSVAQTAVPSDALQLMEILTPAVGNRGAIFQPWAAPLVATIQGPVFVAGPTGSGKRLGCADAAGSTPFAAGELTGKIVFVDRGSCSFSLKIANIKAAGGILGIIGVVTADAPFTGAYGGGDASIPAYMINNADANILRAGNAVVRFSPSGKLSLAGSLASTSSRGPRFDDNIVKPEIGAPGASVSAMSGSFTGTAAFGGTSGAAPMVTGSVALLLEARSYLGISDIKQVLVNTGERNIFAPGQNGSVFPDELAPITRIGGGEVRVDRALTAPAVVSDATGDAVSNVYGAMSFGYLDASKPTTTIERTLNVQNRSNKSQTYTITPTLRFANDNNGAVTMTVSPTSVTVAKNQFKRVKVKLVVDATKLRANLMNSSTGGIAIGPLTANEYDGYVVFQGSDHQLAMPWHILPRKSADVVAKLPTGHLVTDPTTGAGTVDVTNNGVGDAQVFSYATLGTGAARPPGGRGEQSPTPDIKAVGTNTFIVGPGFCTATGNQFVWEFAFQTHERPANPQGIWYEVDLDTNHDGLTDFFVYTRDVSGDTTVTDGRIATAIYNTRTGALALRSNFFFMEHATNSSTLIMRVCGSDLGLGLADIGKPMTADFRVSSWYWGTPESHLGPYTISPLGEEFTASVAGDTLAYKQKGTLNVQQWDPFPGLSPYTGLMMINNSAFSDTNNGGATAASEAILLPR